MTGSATPRPPQRPGDDAVFRAQRRLSRFNLEALVRSAMCVVALMFNETVSIGGGGPAR